MKCFESERRSINSCCYCYGDDALRAVPHVRKAKMHAEGT